MSIANAEPSDLNNSSRTSLVAGLILTVMVGSFVTLYWPTIQQLGGMWRNWESDIFGTALVIWPAALYLAWERRTQFVALPGWHWGGLALVAGLGMVWWLADIVSIELLQQLVVVGLIPACVWAVLGYPAFVCALFPSGLLLFSLGLGQFLVPLLQDLTAWSSVTLLKLTHIPVYLEGRIIMTPSRRWIVADACSGVRWVMASAAFAYVYAGLFFRTARRRAGFIGIAVVLPILVNGFRAYVVPLLDYVFTSQAAQGVDDVLAGWIFFGLIIFILMGVGYLWREPTNGGPTGASVLLPGASGKSTCLSWTQQRSAVILTVFAMAMGPLGASAVDHFYDSNVPKSINTPILIPSPPWAASVEDWHNWKPEFKSPSGEVFKVFVKEERSVALHVAYYPRQKHGAEAMSEGNSLYGMAWESFNAARQSIVVDGQPLVVRRVDVRPRRVDEGGKRILLEWYWIDHAFTADTMTAKLFQLRAYLLGRPQDAAALVVSASYLGDSAEAILAIEDFLRSHQIAPLLDQFTPPALKSN